MHGVPDGCSFDIRVLGEEAYVAVLPEGHLPALAEPVIAGVRRHPSPAETAVLDHLNQNRIGAAWVFLPRLLAPGRVLDHPSGIDLSSRTLRHLSGLLTSSVARDDSHHRLGLGSHHLGPHACAGVGGDLARGVAQLLLDR
ncbi:hypothetical protein [Streptomyces sp. PRh5]|uniref:hypothetical protein n=1 Tax=Streptomyces sp. PRh5 TaxID=1158056 RepID=UPI0004B03B3D|nr:hypothetical protein [Streptomyces sp. PRh5]